MRIIDLSKYRFVNVKNSASNPLYVEVTNPTDLSTVEALLTQIRDSAQAIDENTDLVESKLDSIITEIQDASALNHADLLAVIAELQKLDSNTDGLETQLAQIIANTSTNATEATLLALLTAFNAEDFASETTLLAVKTVLDTISASISGSDPFGNNASVSTVALTDVSATVLVANTNRKEAVIYNGTSDFITLFFGTPAVFGKGIVLAKRETFVVGSYRGLITGIMNTGKSGNIEVTEVTA